MRRPGVCLQIRIDGGAQLDVLALSNEWLHFPVNGAPPRSGSEWSGVLAIGADEIVVSGNADPVADARVIVDLDPLTDAQLDRIGWRHRQGIGDCANQFHYYRRTQDNRIVWGGYDAVYHFGRKVDAAHENRVSNDIAR